MKIAFSILLIIFAMLACGCTGTAPAAPAIPTASPPVTTTNPGLTGIWTGTSAGHFNAAGFREQLSPKYNITEQKGQSFAGSVEYTRPNGTLDSGEFSGVINNQGGIFIAQLDAGTVIGDLTGPDTMELSDIEDEPDAKALIVHLTRQKS